MLEQIFLAVLSMSIIGSIVILAVLGARLVLRRFPAGLSYLLWLTVAAALLLSGWGYFGIDRGENGAMQERTDIAANEYSVGDVDIAQEQPYEKDAQETQERPSSAEAWQQAASAQNAQAPAAPAEQSTPATQPVTPSEPDIAVSSAAHRFPTAGISVPRRFLQIAAPLWLAVCLTFLLTGAVRYLRLGMRLREAIRQEDCVYLTDHSGVPFVYGILTPRIYLPFSLKDEEREVVIAHEQVHIRRRDFLFRALAYLCLSVHWFNPLVYLAVRLSAFDMEASCDERVLHELGEAQRDRYAQILLNRTLNLQDALLPGFAKSNVGKRIRNLYQDRHPSRTGRVVGAASAAAMCAVLAAACAGTNLQAEAETGGQPTISDPQAQTAQENGGNDSTGQTENMENTDALHPVDTPAIYSRYMTEDLWMELQLFDNGAFYIWKPLSSAMPDGWSGTYAVHGETLTLFAAEHYYWEQETGEDAHFVFRIEEDALVFDAARSDAHERWRMEDGDSFTATSYTGEPERIALKPSKRYDLSPQSDEWAAMTRSERMAACDVEEAFADGLSDEELICYLLEYPCLDEFQSAIGLWDADNLSDMAASTHLFAACESRKQIGEALLHIYQNGSYWDGSEQRRLNLFQSAAARQIGGRLMEEAGRALEAQRIWNLSGLGGDWEELALTDMQRLDDDHRYYVGHRMEGENGTQILLRYTTDAEEVWQETLIDVDAEYGDGEVFVSFVDAAHGYLLACSSPAAGLMKKALYETTDGGRSFTLLQTPDTEIEGYPTGLLYTQDGRGIITFSVRGSAVMGVAVSDADGAWQELELPMPVENVRYADGVACGIGSGVLSRTEYQITLKVMQEGDAYAYVTYGSSDGEDWRIETIATYQDGAWIATTDYSEVD